MKKVLGVAAVVLLSAPVVNASALKEAEPKEMTTRESRVGQHVLTLASFDRSKCGGMHARMLPQCNN